MFELTKSLELKSSYPLLKLFAQDLDIGRTPVLAICDLFSDNCIAKGENTVFEGNSTTVTKIINLRHLGCRNCIRIITPEVKSIL